MSSEIPLWVAVVIGLGPSVVAVFAIVDTNIRDRRRLAQERESWLKDKRIEAYRKMLTATTRRQVLQALVVGFLNIGFECQRRARLRAAHLCAGVPAD